MPIVIILIPNSKDRKTRPFSPGECYQRLVLRYEDIFKFLNYSYLHLLKTVTLQ